MHRRLGSLDDRRTQLLFVDDEESFLRYVERNLSMVGLDVVTSLIWDEARGLLKRPDVRPEIIFVEPLSKGVNGSCKLREICTEAKNIPVVVLSISRDPHNIVTAIKAGAEDYVYKPVETKSFCQKILSILESRGDSAALEHDHKGQEVELVFSSPQMCQIHQTSLQIAKTNIPVLIQGESGVGKDVVARLIHRKSSLRDRPFVKVNCAAMPTELVESELFGYRKGAFTGAHTDRLGKFEFANSGTIFLDEIGEFTPSIQAKLLQVLQEGRFTRLGSNRETHVDVRIIDAIRCVLTGGTYFRFPQTHNDKTATE